MGYSPSDYTDTFGGTSSACPGVAGVVALMLSVNPGLRWEEVRDILRETCDRIDVQNGEYDANGHSPWYGYGKVNAEKAVKRAQALGIITLENVRMLSALIDVDGLDSGNETITLRNLTEAEMNLQGWYLEIRGKKIPLSDVLLGNETKTIRMVHSKRCFPNTGATIHLCNASGTILHTVRYTKKQVKKGHSIDFSN